MVSCSGGAKKGAIDLGDGEGKGVGEEGSGVGHDGERGSLHGGGWKRELSMATSLFALMICLHQQ